MELYRMEEQMRARQLAGMSPSGGAGVLAGQQTAARKSGSANALAGQQTAVSHSNRAGFAAVLRSREAEAEQNDYFRLSGGGDTVDYRGVSFFCDRERNTLCLGDCSQPRDCIRVGLSGGGSLLANPENLDELTRAMGMFTPEDQRRIVAALQLHQRAEAVADEIDEERQSIGEPDESDEER